MAISSSPDASEINSELDKSSTSAWSINDGEHRHLAGEEGSGTPIAFSDFIGRTSTSNKSISHSYTGSVMNTTVSSSVQTTKYARTLNITGGSFQIQSDQASYSSNSATSYVRIVVNGSTKWQYARSTSTDTTVNFPIISIPLTDTNDADGIDVSIAFYTGTYNYLINQSTSQDNYRLRNCNMTYTVNA